LRSQASWDVVGLLTTINQVHDRVAMHAVRTELLRAQARAVELPLWEVPIPSPCSNEQYEAAMGATVARARTAGIDAIAFGDLFLEDIRRYREAAMRDSGIAPVFPLWGMPTDALAREMVAGGLRARLTCVDPKQLPPSFAGREFDASLLDDLPRTVDPCGERGEFHTFAYAGPMFRAPLPVLAGDVVERDGFVFADFAPLPFPESLCHTCAAPPRYVRTERSVFVLCPLLPRKYPPQPVKNCELFRPRDESPAAKP
jgi:uncharacterized protein (TIGR00290 family)